METLTWIFFIIFDITVMLFVIKLYKLAKQ